MQLRCYSQQDRYRQHDCMRLIDSTGAHHHCHCALFPVCVCQGQFKANVHQGGSVKPVKISPQVEWLVLECVKIIGLDIAGVDLLIDKVAHIHTHTPSHHAPKRGAQTSRLTSQHIPTNSTRLRPTTTTTNYHPS